MSGLIQVVDSVQQLIIRHREINALLSAMDELKLTNTQILSFDQTETLEINAKTIEIIPVYQWLLK